MKCHDEWRAREKALIWQICGVMVRSHSRKQPAVEGARMTVLLPLHTYRYTYVVDDHVTLFLANFSLAYFT